MGNESFFYNANGVQNRDMLFVVATGCVLFNDALQLSVSRGGASFALVPSTCTYVDPIVLSTFPSEKL